LQKPIRLALALTASDKRKKDYLDAIQSCRQKGMTVIDDWPNHNESKAVIVMPPVDRTKQVADHRISSAFKNAFKGYDTENY
jgi:hypothetical protein